MATREELLGGLQFVTLQAKRVAAIIDQQGDWDNKRPQGWTPKEMFTHVAVTAGMLPAFGAGMISAPPEAELTAGLDINAVNEQGVSSMRAMESGSVVDAIAGNYGKLADWVKSLSDEQLQSQHTFLGMRLSAADLLMTLTVMHSVHHVYEAQLPVAV
jgi:hypothetical protein